MRVSPSSDSCLQQPWMWPHTTRRGRARSTVSRTAPLPRCCPSDSSTWPNGGEWVTRTASSGHPASRDLGFVFAEIEAPGPEWGHGDATAQSPERDTTDFAARAVENVRTFPCLTGPGELLVGFTVSRHQDRGRLRVAQDVDRLLESLPHDRQVARTYQDVGIRRAFDQASSRVGITVHVTESKKSHGVL